MPKRWFRKSRPIARWKAVRAIPMMFTIASLVSIGFCGLILVTAISVSSRLNSAVSEASLSLSTLGTLNRIKADIADLETGQRGYLLTGRKSYLDPYYRARNDLDEQYNVLRNLVMQFHDEKRLNQASALNRMIGMKLAETDLVIGMFQQYDQEAALRLVDTDVGKQAMEKIQSQLEEMIGWQAGLNQQVRTNWRKDIRNVLFTLIALTVSTLFLLSFTLWQMRRVMKRRESERVLVSEAFADAKNEIKIRTAELTELTHHLQQVRENEKRSLARNLHDELGNILVSIKMDFQIIQQELKDNISLPIQTRLKRAETGLAECMAVKRRIIENLRPALLDTLGVGAALELLVEETGGRAKLQYSIHIDEDLVLSDDISIALFRITQEALTNVIAHAHATQVWVAATVLDDYLELSIEDDGIGIVVGSSRGHFSHGISGMRHRVEALNGVFTISRRVQGGTQLLARVPIPQQQTATDEDAETT